MMMHIEFMQERSCYKEIYFGMMILSYFPRAKDNIPFEYTFSFSRL